MNVLPWLLDWPPSPATVVVFLLLTSFSMGTLVVFSGVTEQIAGGNVTVESANFSVRLNDEIEYPDTETGTVQRCLASGTPGDKIAVVGDMALDVPPEEGEQRLMVEVSLAHTDETTTNAVEGSGQETSDVFWLLDDDETLKVGDEATVQIRIHDEGATITSATQPVTVKEGSRTYDC